MDTEFRKPPPISESVVDYIRGQIVNGKLKPGQKINEVQISEQLGVSRSPIREAYRTLAREGLVTILPRKGTIISNIIEQELSEIFEVREMIELYAVDLISRKRRVNLKRLENRIKILEPDIVQIDRYLEQITAFHETLVEVTGNQLLLQFYIVLCNSLRRYQHLAAAIPDRMDLSIKEHEQIFNAISQKKYRHAKQLIKKHLKDLETIITREIYPARLSSANKEGKKHVTRNDFL